jgi:hypothetical protein
MNRPIVPAIGLSLGMACLVSAATDERVWTSYVGKSTTGDSFIRLRQSGNDTNVLLSGVGYDDRSYHSPQNYGFRYTVYSTKRPWLGFGFDYFHYKVYADLDDQVFASGTVNGQPVNQSQTLGQTFQRFFIANGVNYFMANVILRTTSHVGKPFQQGRFRAYVGLGGGPIVVYPSVRIEGESVGKYQLGGWGWHAFGGVEYMLNEDMGLFVEGKYSNDSVKFDVPDGTARTRLSTRHIAIGVNLRR